MNYKKVDELANRVGGSLRLTSLIISRARQIVKKSSVLVKTDTDDPVQISFAELMDGKIRLSDGDERSSGISGESEKQEKPLQEVEKP